MIKIGSLVIHCYEFNRMAAFWAAALGYEPREPGTAEWVVLTDPDGNLFCVIDKGAESA